MYFYQIYYLQGVFINAALIKNAGRNTKDTQSRVLEEKGFPDVSSFFGSGQKLHVGAVRGGGFRSSFTGRGGQL